MRVLFCAAALGVALVGPVWAEEQARTHHAYQRLLMVWAKDALALAETATTDVETAVAIACALATDYDDPTRTEAITEAALSENVARELLAHAKGFLTPETEEIAGLIKGTPRSTTLALSSTQGNLMRTYARLENRLTKAKEQFATCGVILPTD